MNLAGRRPQVALGGTLLVAGAVLLQPFPTNAESKPRQAGTTRLAQKDRGSPSGAPAGRGATGPCVHVVRHGESASRIAERHGVSRRRLMEANSLPDHAGLRVGRTLVIPGCPTRAPQEAHTPVTPSPGQVMLARVGPLRVPTRFFMGVPERDAIPVSLVWPVEGPVVSGFGRRRHGWHAGLDIKADRGTPILAAASGVVSFSGWEPAYGRVIKIEHPHGFRTIYAHNLQNHVQPGEWVDTGALIGLVGNSGRTTGTHLHFELRREELVHNPVFFLSRRDTIAVAAIAPSDQPGHEGGP